MLSVIGTVCCESDRLHFILLDRLYFRTRFHMYLSVMKMRVKNTLKSAIEVLPSDVKRSINMLPENVRCEIREILLRVGKPVLLSCGEHLFYLRNYGRVGELPSPDSIIVSDDMMRRTFMSMCDDSVYSYMDNITSGFLTLPGGSRVGVCGRFVSTVPGKRSVRDISSLSIRIACDYSGAADDLIRLYAKSGIGNTIVVGPPCSGKTTFLRDLCRELSSGITGNNCKISLIDERSEISGAISGKAFFDVGVNTDVYLNYSKSEAIVMSVRTMSPDVIIFDEIGTEKEVLAVREGMNSGVDFIFSLHAHSKAELMRKEQYKLLSAFADIKYLVFLTRDKPGKIDGILVKDENGNFIDDGSNGILCWNRGEKPRIQKTSGFDGNEEIAS